MSTTRMAAVQRRLLREPRRPAAVRGSPHAHWYVLGAVCTGAFMGQLDASIVTVALPRIGQSLHASAATVQWVALSYMLVLLAALLAAGALADLFGRKLLYTYGFAVFTLGSLLCGLSSTLPLLIGARVLQGLGAAMLQANSVALIREAMPAGRLNHGIGIQGAAQAIGLALGPAVGGLLIGLGGWRLIFFVNVPVGIVAIVLARLLIPRSRLGVLHERRWSGLLSLLRTPAIAFGAGGGLISYLVMFGALFVVPYYLLAAGISPSASGLQLAVMPIALGIVAPLAGRLADRIGARPLTVGGLLLAAVGLAVIALMHGLPARLAGLAVTGAGLGAFTPVNNAAVMAAGPRERAGVLGGLVNMTRTLGAILGVALASLVYESAAGHSSLAKSSVSAATSAHGLTLTLLLLSGLAAAGALALLMERTDRSALSERATPA
ncbi:MAG TPA: MFS transporter [Solirubrobacteraceae bacterium]|nr:MFS transporter [Solirubrobacteraceae bacterium]